MSHNNEYNGASDTILSKLELIADNQERCNNRCDRWETHLAQIATNTGTIANELVGLNKERGVLVGMAQGSWPKIANVAILLIGAIALFVLLREAGQSDTNLDVSTSGVHIAGH